MSILKAENIYKSYTDTQKRVDVLKGIDLEVCEGESVAIVGPSGAGKSTLLHVLGGLDVPDKGAVLLNGTFWTQLASWYALRGNLLQALRNE